MQIFWEFYVPALLGISVEASICWADFFFEISTLIRVVLWQWRLIVVPLR